MKFLPFEREMLRVLFEKDDWVDFYFFHDKYLLSPGQIAHAIRNFSENNIAEAEERRIRLMPHAYDWVYANRKAIFLSRTHRYWSKPMVERQQESIDPTTPYLPSLGSVDFRFFSDR